MTRRGGERSEAHRALVNRILSELGSYPGVILYSNDVRVAFAHGHQIVTGLAEGTPDIVGFIAPYGRGLGLEIKTGRAVANSEQKLVHEAWRAIGVHVAIIRNVSEAYQAIAAARCSA